MRGGLGLLAPTLQLNLAAAATTTHMHMFIYGLIMINGENNALVHCTGLIFNNSCQQLMQVAVLRTTTYLRFRTFCRLLVYI